MLPSFINPVFLSGLLLLALPVLLHLFRRERDGGSGFPSLMFVERVSRPLRSQLRLRHRWLLLLRCLLVVLLVVAFARPFLTQLSDDMALADRPRDTVVLLDRSYSMSHGQNWTDAVQATRQLVENRLAGEQLALLVFDETSETLVEWTNSETELLSALTSLRPGFAATRVRGAIEQADRLLASSLAESKRIALISDFPAGMLAEQTPGLSPGVLIETYPVSGIDASSSIQGVAVESAGNSISVEVDVVRFGDADAMRLLLASADRTIASKALSRQSLGAETIRFDNIELGTDRFTGKLVIESLAAVTSAPAHFVYSSQQQLPVLVVSGETMRRNQLLYLEQALSQLSQPAVRYDLRTWSSLDPQVLSEYRVVILNDVELPTGIMAQAVQDFVRAGGGLFLATGESTPRQWRGDATTLLPGTASGRSLGEAQRITVTDNNHPLIARLKDRDVDLTTVRFDQRHEVQASGNDRVIASFGDGNAALLERQLGAGRIILLPSTLDRHWNDLALQPAYLPLLHAVTAYLADFQLVPVAYRVGQTVDLLAYSRALLGSSADSALTANSRFTVESPSGKQLRLASGNPVLTVTEAGIYRIFPSGAGNRVIELAVNVDAGEFDPAQLDLEVWLDSLATADRVLQPFAVDALNRQFESDQRWWRVLLWCVILLLLFEFFVLSRARFARKTAAG